MAHSAAPAQPPSLRHPRFYEEESRLQPGARRQLTLVHADLAVSEFETPIHLTYQWNELLSDDEARRLAKRAIAFVSCAIYDAAKAAGLDCRVSANPIGRRPAWLLAGERMPVSLVLSDINLEERTCIMHIGPLAVARSQLALPGVHWQILLASFQTRFSSISI